MPELRVPLAADVTGILLSPADAEKDKRYFCPACREPVVLRQGEIKVAHFAHKVSDNCNQETILHKTAKLLIQHAVAEWKHGKSGPPMLQRACQVCGSSLNQPLPDKVDAAVLEYALSDGSIVDVALIVGEIARAAVEIKVTHAMDVTKANRLPVPFIELDGYKVIQNPSLWKPITDTFGTLTCRKCKSSYSAFQTKAQRVAKATDIDLPTSYYRYGLCNCWKCKRYIVVFTWPKDGLHDDDAPLVNPVPRTIQYRFSRMAGGQYWANTCPYCKSIQGDFFLHSEPDGPFFSTHIGEDSPTAFRADMMRIATYAAQLGLL
jgi:hypothetical protein